MIAAVMSAVRCAAAVGPSRPVSTASSIAWSWAETRGIRGQPRSAHGVLEQLRRAGQEGHVGRDELDGRAPRGRAAARAREAGEDSGSTIRSSEAHRQLRLGGLTEDGEHHPARDARRVAPRPCRHVHESEVVPHLAVRHAERLGEGLALVAAAEAQRGVSLGQQADRLVPLVADDVERNEPLLDEAAEEAERLRRRGRAERHALRAEHLGTVGGQECDQEVRGGLSGEWSRRA